MIADKEFRSDLYYRLNVFPIRIAPLRERKEDIPRLVSYFVQKFAKQMQKKIETISPAVMKGLASWDWPGNIRELENFIERAVIVTRGRSLEAPLGELRKLTAEPAPAARNSAQEDIARIVKETLTALNGDKNSAGERAKKQRAEIVHALRREQGSRRRCGWGGRPHGYQSHHAAFSDQEIRVSIPSSTRDRDYEFLIICRHPSRLTSTHSIPTKLQCSL
jgi:formate hydrogenlyase transcriptional activator